MLNQTVQDFEIIVVDGGSRDEGPRRVKSFKDPRIHLVQQKGKGVANARNEAISFAQSEFLAFLDADDEWMPDFLQTIVILSQHYPDAGIFGTNFYVRTKNQVTTTYDNRMLPKGEWEGIIKNYFLVAAISEPLTTSAIALPKHIFYEFGGFPEGINYGEDTLLWGKIALNYDVAYSTHICAVYHQDAQNRLSEIPSYRLAPHPFAHFAQHELLNKKISEPKIGEIQEYIASKEINRAYFNYITGKSETAGKIAQSIQTNFLVSKRLKLRVLLITPLPVFYLCKKIANIVRKYHSTFLIELMDEHFAEIRNMHPGENMKIVMLRSNPISPDVRLEKEAVTLAKAGHEVTLIGWQRYGNAPRLEKRSNYTIKRIQIQAPCGMGIIFFLPIWWIFVFITLLTDDWDIVHAADLDTYIPALFAAKLKKKKLVYDIFDFYIDMIPLPCRLRNIFAKIDIFLMRFADAIIVVDPCRLKQIKREDDLQVGIIFNSPMDVNRAEAKFPVHEHSFKIFYAGSLFKDRDIGSICEIVKHDNDLQLEIVGWGQGLEDLFALINGTQNIVFSGMIPYNEVIQKTLDSDLLFALYDPAVPNNRYASPNKLFEAMMCEQPILVSDETAMADIVRCEHCGVVVPYGDLNAILRAVMKLKNDPDLCRSLAANGRKAYEQKYNWKIMESKLLKIYDNLSSPTMNTMEKK